MTDQINETQYPPFFVFEGVDNSGKTTLSKTLAARHPEYTWTKEPVFTTEQADRLNSTSSTLTDAEREVLFLEGRLSQQRLYKTMPCLLDRYLWSGLAYAKAFSPSIFDFCVALYQDYNIFRKPTAIFYMDTPLDTCRSREPDNAELTIERLQTLSLAYRDTEKYIHCPVIHVDGTKSVDECVDFVDAEIKRILETTGTVPSCSATPDCNH